MPVERYDIGSFTEWQELRRQDITASVAGALLGVHDYMSIWRLYGLKAGLLAEDEENAAMQRGKILESIAMQVIQRERPDWQLRWNGSPGQFNGTYFRDPDHRLGATPDLFVHDPARGPGLVQFKTADRSVFYSKWFAGHEQAAAEPPLWIAVQAILEAHLTGVQWVDVAVMVVSDNLDTHIINIPIHTGIINRLRTACAEFWDRIARHDPPPPDYARDGTAIAALYGEDNGREVDLRGDNSLPLLLEERVHVASDRKAAQARLDTINAELVHKLGNHVAGYLPGWRITNKTQSRKQYTAPATSFRVLRVSRKD